MAACLSQLLKVLLCLVLQTALHDVSSEVVSSRSKECTYFGMGRKPKEIYGLSNCTWYRERSCCTWTEVMSVFQKMMPLQTSSEDCRNRMNYLMCYFCSPDQNTWYREKVYVCKSFCDTVYSHCKDAKYEGSEIGDKYSDGRGFCEAQHFHVVDDNKECFEFDNSPFGGDSTMLTGQLRVTLIFLGLWLLIYLVLI